MSENKLITERQVAELIGKTIENLDITVEIPDNDKDEANFANIHYGTINAGVGVMEAANTTVTGIEVDDIQINDLVVIYTKMTLNTNNASDLYYQIGNTKFYTKVDDSYKMPYHWQGAVLVYLVTALGNKNTLQYIGSAPSRTDVGPDPSNMYLNAYGEWKRLIVPEFEEVTTDEIDKIFDGLVDTITTDEIDSIFNEE